MRKHRRDAGFSMAALIFFATAASILAAAAIPAYQMQAKREVEEELIFRGQEYTRAIQKYQRRFGVYPTSIDQLVSTNGLRFVRRAYKDPVTGKDFRLIFINPDGSVTGSKLFTQNVNSQPLFGNGVQPFGQGQNNPQQQNNNPNNNNNNNRPNNGLPGNTPGLNNNSSNISSPFGGIQGQTQTGNNRPNNGLQSQPNQPGQANNQQRPAGQTGGNGPNFTAVPNTTPGSSTGAGGTQVASGGIIGVASDSGKDSIKLYNNRQKYDEWEFIAILNQQGQQQQNGQNPQQNQQQNQQQNGQRPNSPFNTTPNSPFGGAPTGGNGATRPNPNPFGFGPNQPNQPQPNRPGKLP